MTKKYAGSKTTGEKNGTGDVPRTDVVRPRGKGKNRAPKRKGRVQAEGKASSTAQGGREGKRGREHVGLFLLPFKGGKPPKPKKKPHHQQPRGEEEKREDETRGRGHISLRFKIMDERGTECGQGGDLMRSRRRKDEEQAKGMKAGRFGMM